MTTSIDYYNMTEQYQPLEQDTTTLSPRSIDDYLETAYKSSSISFNNSRIRQIAERWRYYIIFLALGIANSGDSAEMGCTNFLLSSERFQQDVSFQFFFWNWISCVYVD